MDMKNGVWEEQKYKTDGITLEDYNENTGANESLEPGQVLFYKSDGAVKDNTVVLQNKPYTIKAAIESIAAAVNAGKEEDSGFQTWHYYRYDVAGDEANLPVFYESLRDEIGESIPSLFPADNIDDARTDFFESNGTILFIGIFFVVLFSMGTVIIIYYKQITEGLEDRDRFRIMKQVGMSDKEIRQTIKRQVLMVFFLPLGTAVLHIAVAFPMLCQLLAVFDMTNIGLLTKYTIFSILLFTILYFAVYKLTERTYYKIVQKNVK